MEFGVGSEYKLWMIENFVVRGLLFVFFVIKMVVRFFGVFVCLLVNIYFLCWRISGYIW